MNTHSIEELKRRHISLEHTIKGYGSALVAFSGGVDSTLLLRLAVDALGKNVLAATFAGELHAAEETGEAVRLAREMGAEHFVLKYDTILDSPVFITNPPDRCYHCKKYFYQRLLNVAAARGINVVIDGSNASDMDDYRPGMRAGLELGVLSPLRDAGLVKDDVRALSRILNLPTANKPGNPCLASRFPYGSAVTAKGLRQVSKAEALLREIGVLELRVRHHGNLARIEVTGKYQDYVMKRAEELVAKFKALGYDYVALDLLGYRPGSMNEPLSKKA